MKSLVKIGIAGLFIFMSSFTCAEEKKSGDMAADIGTVGIPVIAGSIALYKEDYDGFWMFAKGAAYTLVATQALKYTVKEERPNGEDNLSFPSGHSSSAFQGASYLQFRYGWEYGLPAYIGAGLVGYSRVENEHHYWRDVIAGAVLATTIQYLVTDKYIDSNQVMIVPVINQDQVGIAASFSF
ncbi:phosphatase PAP2 family protein [Aliivibrio finisterrensis]|uniref:Phosphatase PAP2 family protein n=1 Tax=Aliivibrio finisterrensis TaxID=511998 RepID=A0A6N6RX12_9GAMM|nr:phosphatase PAP2 family protein [Aliivibrio finisterrensis]KAB2826316.1 phosphatase PAP2 family protein [Aliivibrio finisterrensis]